MSTVATQIFFLFLGAKTGSLHLDMEIYGCKNTDHQGWAGERCIRMINKQKVVEAIKGILPMADEAAIDRIAQESITDAEAILYSLIRQKSLQEREIIYRRNKD